jgi:type II secretory pathway component GspD/PulD (secretin)
MQTINGLLMQRTLTILILYFLASFLTPLSASAQDMAKTKITLHLKDASLKEVIQVIERQTSFKFLARAEDLEKELHIHIEATDQPLTAVLEKVLSGRGLTYKQMEGNILIQGIAQESNATNPQNIGQSPDRPYAVHGIWPVW